MLRIAKDLFEGSRQHDGSSCRDRWVVRAARCVAVAAFVGLLGVPTASMAVCPIGGPSVPFCDDFSGPNPLASYIVVNPDPGNAPFIISITNGALVFTDVLNTPLAFAHVISSVPIGYKKTLFEADLRFDTLDPYLRSAMNLEWTTPALNTRIGLNLQLDDRYANFFVATPSQFGQRFVSWPLVPNRTYRLGLEIDEVPGASRATVLAFKGYIDGALILAETEDSLGINLSALPAQLNPAFHGGSYSWSAVNQVFDNASVKRFDPIANAGPDQSVDEMVPVTLDGSASTGRNIAYSWEQVPGPISVALTGATTARPSFTAPQLPGGFGSQVLSFKLMVSSGAQSSWDTVDVTVVNVNHAPEAHPGADQRVDEGGVVRLDGGYSFDIDGDAMTYLWQQTGGTSVVLQADPSGNPAKVWFVAPTIPGGLSSDKTLTFKLTVSDGGLSSDGSLDVVVENVNHPPTANAGGPQTVRPGTAVYLVGSGEDPDWDLLTYQWAQVSGPVVTLINATGTTANFVAPAVSGTTDLAFRLTASDGLLSGSSDVVITVKNGPPVCSQARAVPDVLWPPIHRLVSVAINGVTDPDDGTVATSITGVTQDEPVSGLGDGDTSPDALIEGAKALLRAERSGLGNGRVYRINFTASDGNGGTCAGFVRVAVPQSMKAGDSAIDSGQLYDSTQP